MIMPRPRLCPNDGTVMLVTNDEAVGTDFKCPKCGIEKTNVELDMANEEDRLREPKSDGV